MDSSNNEAETFSYVIDFIVNCKNFLRNYFHLPLLRGHFGRDIMPKNTLPVDLQGTAYNAA